MQQLRRKRRWSTVSEALLSAIENSDLSYQAIERETGVKRQSLMRFTAGEQSLRLDLADKLVVFFELELITKG